MGYTRNMFIAILGRQPALSLAELEALYGASAVTALSRDAALVQTDHLSVDDLGGSLKCGVLIHDCGVLAPAEALRRAGDWIAQRYSKAWRHASSKITLGISVYGMKTNGREVQKIGLVLKRQLKQQGVSLRLIPNIEPALSTATSHNNKLGRSEYKVELLIVRGRDGRVMIAESRGAQNIAAYTKRDRFRPRRDAFVGMLPPKLAQMMVNLALGSLPPTEQRCVLDPFCGTGTVLQEALLKGYSVMGSDLSDKMISYSTENLAWLKRTHRVAGSVVSLQQADAMAHRWNDADRISAVVCETYLGQPFSAPPRPEKLREVVGNCNHIISSFLCNLQPQLAPGTRCCLALPAWRGTDGKLTHLPLLGHLEQLGYQLERPPLLYARPDQVVAREIIILTTKNA